MAKLSDFLLRIQILKKTFFSGGEGRGGGGSRISEFFLQRIQIYNNCFFFGGG